MKLMDYSGENPPFKVGDVVECICDEMPEFYDKHWLHMDGISKGDRLEVNTITDEEFDGWQWWVTFAGKDYGQSARLFKLVEPESPSGLETSGDVLQALKIAAGVQ